MAIVPLAEAMQHAPALARWHFAEWSYLDAGMSEASLLAELQSHTHPSTIPTTWVALDECGAPIGSVSLLQNDHQKIRAYSPWLASLYVRKDCRAQGLGRRLVAHCMDAARDLKVKTLYLYTDQQVPYYQELGWRVVDRVPFRDFIAVVMAFDLQDASGAGDRS